MSSSPSSPASTRFIPRIFDTGSTSRSLFIVLLAIGSFALLPSCAQAQQGEELPDFPAVATSPDAYNDLSPEESRVLLQKGTEMAFTGAYHNSKEPGTYLCRQCNLPLFRSSDKFDSRSGWPSFDDMIEGAVTEVPDKDGYRTEIICSNCGGHLGHVFRGEGFTSKQTRHCVNSVSLSFVPMNAGAEGKQTGVYADGKLSAADKKARRSGIIPLDEYTEENGLDRSDIAVFAGGCFWCVEAAFELIDGVEEAVSGYAGGEERYPTYEAVGRKQTGHAEAVAVFYDSDVVSYATLLDVFFTAHDPTQLNRQGPDVGPQYRSAIFYRNEEEKDMASRAIGVIDASGMYAGRIVTELNPYTEFWTAEDYHQDYYDANPQNPYVQRISKPKVEKVAKKFSDRLKDKKAE